MSDRDVLLEQIQAKAIVHGRVTLASGPPGAACTSQESPACPVAARRLRAPRIPASMMERRRLATRRPMLRSDR